MGQLKRIVVGHDLRAAGEMAVHSAAAFAHQYGASIKLVHVVEPYHLYQKIPLAPRSTPYTLEEISRMAKGELEAVAAQLAHLPTQCEVRIGKPWQKRSGPYASGECGRRGGALCFLPHPHHPA